MAKNVFVFKCPCCGKDIEVDTRSGTIRALKFEDSAHGKSLDKLVVDQKHESDRLEGMLDKASGSLTGDKKRLDDLFGDALEQAKKDKDKKPRNPFDLE